MRRRRDPLRDPEALLERIYGFVAYRVGAGPEADDITSETFERALRYRDSFDPARGEPVAWLIGIARRCIEDARTTTAAGLDDAADTPQPSFEDAALSRLDLGDALALLSPRDRELVALRYGADLATARIAELLGMSPNAVDVALHRALARLREHLERPGGETDARLAAPR